MKSASNRGSQVKVNVVVLLKIREGNDSLANASVKLEGDDGLGIRAWSFLILGGTILFVPTFSPLARHPLLPIYHRLHAQDMTALPRASNASSVIPLVAGMILGENLGLSRKSTKKKAHPSMRLAPA